MSLNYLSPSQNSNTLDDDEVTVFSEKTEEQRNKHNFIDEFDCGEDDKDARKFTILDDVDDSEGEETQAKTKRPESDSEEELTAEKVQEIFSKTGRTDFPTKEKLTFHKQSVVELEDLPPDWILKEYIAGICFYIHVPTNVISTTRPYMLGTGSIKKHKLCANAMPCLDYTRSGHELVEEMKRNPDARSEVSNDHNFTSNVDVEMKENEDSTVSNPELKEVLPNQSQKITNIPDVSNTECHADSVQKHKKNFLIHEEAVDYFKKLYRQRTIKIRKFSSWKMKRAFVHKQKCKNKITKNVPATPEGMVVIKIPKFNARTNKLEMTDWTLNPNGKSFVCLLHEYLQRSVKTHPVYECKELENAKTPYMATIKLNNMQYGSGIGSSKKVAKSEAARATLEILIPQIKCLWKKDESNTDGAKVQDEANYSLFDGVLILDPNVIFYCKRLNEVQPFAMLHSCVEKNFDDSYRILQNMKTVENENVFSIKVGDYAASARCTSKNEGRQRASQKILQKLHPQVHYLGSLLRLYGNAVMKGIKEKKSGNAGHKGPKRKLNTDAPNIEVLSGLRETISPIYADRKQLLEKGQFEKPVDIDETVMNMYLEMKAKCKKAKRCNLTDKSKQDSDETSLFEQSCTPENSEANKIPDVLFAVDESCTGDKDEPFFRPHQTNDDISVIQKHDTVNNINQVPLRMSLPTLRTLPPPLPPTDFFLPPPPPLEPTNS